MKDLEVRIAEILAKMSLLEKIGQLNLLHGVVDADREAIRAGKVGGFLLGPPRPSDGSDFSWAKEVNELQRIAAEESPSKVPLLMARDVVHGHRTVFPIPLGQAATFDPPLVKECARISSLEASAQGVRWNYSPMLDLARDPRWGRVAEGYGEDPYLCGALAQAVVEGYQGGDANSVSLAACAKHYVGYGAPQAGKDYGSVEMSERALREVYLPSFAAAVRSGAVSIMAGLHDLNGIPMTASKRLLKEILREELGFTGLIVSDWGAIADLLCHRVAETEEEAVAQALDAGVEMDMVSGLFLKHLPQLVRSGRISESLIDACAASVLQLKFKLRLFQNPYVDPSRETSEMLLPEHRTLARKAASEGIILLENRGQLLPLSPEIKSIAVVGPLAEAKLELLGSWSLDGRNEDVVSILEGIRSEVPKAWVISDGVLTDAALAHAPQAEVILLVLGEHQTRSGEAASVADISLPPGQEELLRKIAAYGKPLVVVIVAGRPLAIEAVSRYADAVLYCFQPGIETGSAVAEILFGRTAPSGKAPISFPRASGQIPIYYNERSTGRRGKADFRYSSKFIDLPHTPLYPFGFGLSYSTFEYTDLRLSAETLSPDSTLVIEAGIKNTGAVHADETVLCFIRDEVRSVSPPEWELKAFLRLSLIGGETKQAHFELKAKDLAFWKAAGTWIAEAGRFSVRLGCERGPNCFASFSLAEDVEFPDFLRTG